MVEFETLGYVLSPARPPIVRAAILEDVVGEISVGDLVGIPIVIPEEKSMFILGNVLSITTYRPILNADSKAPYALARGDTMNLVEDIDMLEFAELEDIAYVADVFVHSFVYEGKYYSVNLVLPGSKLVRLPNSFVEEAFSKGEIDMGFIRGYSARLKLSKDVLKKGNIVLLGEQEKRVKEAVRIADELDNDTILYIGSYDIGRDGIEVIHSQIPEGKRVVKNPSGLMHVLNELSGVTIILDDFTKAPMEFLSVFRSYAKHPKIARILLDELRGSIISTSVKVAETVVIFGDPIHYKLYDPKGRITGIRDYYRRTDIISGLGEGEKLVVGKAVRFGVPLVVVERSGAAGIRTRDHGIRSPALYPG